MRRISDLGKLLLIADPSGQLVPMEHEKTQEWLAIKTKMMAKAMAVISTFAAVEHEQNKLLIKVASKDPVTVYAMFGAIRADGAKRDVVSKMLDRHVTEQDRQIHKLLLKMTEKASKQRNNLAHRVQFSIPMMPNYMVLIDPALLSIDEADQKAKVLDAISKGEHGPVRLDDGRAFDDALVIEEGDLDCWIQANENLRHNWGLFLTLIDQESIGHKAEVDVPALLRSVLMNRLRRVTP